MEIFFDGTGFSPADARENAFEQADAFIKEERANGKKLININKNIQSTSQNGNLYFCSIKLTYDEN